MPELRGKLNTSVNGPEDPDSVFDGDAWEQVDWRVHEERVRRLRCRIFKAAKDGDLATVTQVSLLCRWVLPGQPDGLDFFQGGVFGLSGPKSGGDEDAAELGEHVCGGGVGLGAVPGPAGAVGGDVVGVVAGGGVPADRQGQAGQAEGDGPLDCAGLAGVGLADTDQLLGVFDGYLDCPAGGVALYHLAGGGLGIGGDQREVVAAAGVRLADQHDGDRL